MDKEKEQLQEIIDRLEEYKEQWQNVAKEYEIAQNEIMASQILGADWESQILSGRIDTLNTFAQNYIAIQQAIADAAWASANAQIEAAKEAQKGANGNAGGAGSVGDNTSVYEVVYEDGAQSVKTFTNKKDAQNYANAMSDGIPDDEPSYYVKLKKYSKGGVISAKKENELTPIAKRIGEDVIISAKEGERVLTPVQNDMWEKWTEAIPNLLDLSNMIKVNIPDYSKISGMVSKAQTIEQHNQFNITLPNITDSTKATKLFEELQRLPLDALQESHKRKM